jgi:outer membrane lipoprotein-sorting protein
MRYSKGFVLPFLMLMILMPLSVRSEDLGEKGGIALDQVLESSSLKYHELDGFSCRFRQVVDIPLLEKRKEFSGRLLYRNPNKLRLDYQEPAGGYILCDGSAFYVYLPDVDSTTVMKTRMDSDPRNFLTEFFLEEARSDYEAALLSSEGESYALEFIPKDQRAGLLRVDMIIDKKSRLVKSVSYVDPSGSTTSYFLEGITIHPQPEERFRFVLSEGLKLMDLTSDQE